MISLPALALRKTGLVVVLPLATSICVGLVVALSEFAGVSVAGSVGVLVGAAIIAVALAVPETGPLVLAGVVSAIPLLGYSVAGLTFRITIVGLLLLATMVWLFGQSRSGVVQLRSTWPVVLYIAVAFGVALNETREGQPLAIAATDLIKFNVYIGAFWVARAYVRSRPTAIKGILIMLILGGLFPCAVALLEVVGGPANVVPQLSEFMNANSSFDVVNEFGVVYNRVGSTLGHANAFGDFAAIELLITLGLLTINHLGIPRPFLVAATSVFMGAIVLTASRQALGGLVVGAGILVLVGRQMIVRERIGLGTDRQARAPVQSRVLLLAAVPLIVLALSWQIFGSRFISLQTDVNVTSRLVEDQVGLALLGQSPLVGWGHRVPGLYGQVLAAGDADSIYVANDPGVAQFRDTTGFLSNGFLSIAVVSGVVGLASYLVVMLALVVRCWRLITRTRSAGADGLAAAICLSVVALVMTVNLVDHTLAGDASLFGLFWLIVGFGWGATDQEGSPKRTEYAAST